MVAELLRLPAVGGVVEPLFVRSGRYPSAMLGPPPGGSTLIRTLRLGRLFNHLTHLVVEQLYWPDRMQVATYGAIDSSGASIAGR